MSSTMTICKVDHNNVYTGDSKIVSSRLIIPNNWIIIDEPVLAEGQVAIFNGKSWKITDNPPM